MIENLPSVTAMAVSFARGLSGAGTGGVRDPLASVLLPGPIGGLLRGLERLTQASPRLERVMGIVTLGLVDHAGLRTEAIDRAVQEGVALGARQLVLVGAGLDARAHRLRGLSDVDVFEVDHPTTQGLKRSKAGRLPASCKSIAYVSVDFGKESVEAKLLEAGYRPKVPTVFVWEGVTMYLPAEATRATIATLAKCAAKGSTLAMTYVEPKLATIHRSFRPAVLSMFALVGEPVIGQITRTDVAALLREHGFTPVDDSGTHDWVERHGRGEKPPIGLHERLVVARKA